MIGSRGSASSSYSLFQPTSLNGISLRTSYIRMETLRTVSTSLQFESKIIYRHFVIFRVIAGDPAELSALAQLCHGQIEPQCIHEVWLRVNQRAPTLSLCHLTVSERLLLGTRAPKGSSSWFYMIELCFKDSVSKEFVIQFIQQEGTQTIIFLLNNINNLNSRFIIYRLWGAIESSFSACAIAELLTQWCRRR